MNLLALDTSTRHAAVVVERSDGRRFAALPDPDRRHGRSLIPAVRDLLAAAGLAVRDLDGLAVGLGPGSYTGLRIGLTAAKTLAYATGKPLAGLDSLEILARNAPADAQRVAVVADAQHGHLYTALFERAGPDEPLIRTVPARIVPRSAWIAGLSEGTFVLGPELAKLGLPPDLPATIAPDVAFGRPHSDPLAELARAALAQGERIDPWFAEPLYLRPSAAEEQWGRR